MALKSILISVLTSVLLHSATYADCASEAREAREAILTSGPFQYKSRQWDEHSDWLKVGLIQPNKAEHVLEWTVDLHGRREAREEEIWIGEQGWLKDSFGWLVFLREPLHHQLTVPESPYEASSSKCLGTVEVEGKNLTVYEQNAKMGRRTFVEKFFVDPVSRLTVRYERNIAPGSPVLGEGSWQNVTSTYRYDAAIKIEPPKLDIAESQAKSLQVFQRDIDFSDAACRQEVIRTINRGRPASPFKYKIVDFLGERHGTFVPPSSYHDIDEVRFFNRGGETLRINDRSWMCTRKSGWEERHGFLSMRDTSRDFSFLGFVSAHEHIRDTKCFGDIYFDKGRFRFYEYSVYFGAGELVGSKWRMYVATPGDIPTVFEVLQGGAVAAVRLTRVYDKNITITPPAGACSFPITNERF